MGSSTALLNRWAESPVFTGDVHEGECRADPELPVMVKLSGLGGTAGDRGLRCGWATREGDGGLLVRVLVVGEIGVLAGRGPGSRSRGREGKRWITDGETGGRSADVPGLFVGTDGNRGSVGIASSSSSIEGNACVNSDME